MTQLQLQNLIKNSLGPLIDAAIRAHPSIIWPTGAIALYQSYTSQLNASTITLTQFNALVSTLVGQWDLNMRVQFFIAVARANGDLPAAPTSPRGDRDWPSSDWNTIVNA